VTEEAAVSDEFAIVDVDDDMITNSDDTAAIEDNDDLAVGVTIADDNDESEEA
jgi:hypothetical protein